MTTNAATKTKTKKLTELHPPAEISGNTKARRAWMAEQIAANTMPGRSAKVLGKGSYECVAVYEHTEVEGRERFRGMCQVCGGAQVVESGVLVLHGYNRPGCGYIIGECPGVREVPLQTSDALTRKYHAAATSDAEIAKAVLAKAEITYTTTLKALYGDDFKDRETRLPSPKLPRTLYGRDNTAEEKALYAREVAEWRRHCPLHAAHNDASEVKREAQSAVYKVEAWLRHLNDLLKLNLVGTPLIREVVA
jgi:hypothetical protein